MTVSPISLAGPSLPQMSVSSAPSSGSLTAGGFSGIVERFLGSAAASHQQANTAVTDLALGQTDNIHNVLMQVAQADLSFRLILEIRNRLTEAYQEVMKMQI